MASRRLDISSLLCDDPPPAAFSPLDALVQAATEERQRLDASHDPPPTKLPYHVYAYQEAHLQRQNEIDRLNIPGHDPRLRDDDDRRIRDQYERHQQRERELERQRMYEQQRMREADRLRQREELRELERARLLEQERIARERELEVLHRQHRPQPTPHPPSISHLISHPPPRHHQDPVQINISPTLHSLPAPVPLPSPDNPRPIKKRRFSESPTRPFPDDKERIARERDKMLVGELGYGRVDSPAAAGPSHPPRRPGSGHGHSRKPVAVSDLLVDKEPIRPHEADSHPNHYHHHVASPLGRRSPPGSQIGRAKAARKSDDHLLREPPPIVHLPADPEAKKPKEEPKIKQEFKSSRSDDIRSAIIEEPRPKKPKEVPLPPPKVQQEDAHEWFLQQFDQEPSPTTSARPEPPHSPSPSPSPVIPIAPAPSAKSPPPRKPLTPIPPTVPTLEQELEELVSEPTSTSVIVVKTQEADLDMDLDVDLAVTELVDTLEDEGPKRESVGMEVDVEDELLSLVDDRPPPPAPARRAPGPSSTSVSHASAPPQSIPTTKSAPPVHRSISEARQEPSPPSMSSSAVPASATSLSVARQSSARPTPERGSMPPPASTNVGTTSKKVAERADSVAPAGPSVKKKKETSTKAAPKAKTTTASASAAKPRAKPTAKGKKGSAVENATPAIGPSKPPKTLPGKKTAPSVSRSRSTSVMPGRSASAGPENDAVKAEKQEEEEESEAEKEDDKLYCVCRTKYDEDRFMIACDRCDEWYHTQCVHMPDLEVDLVDQFICPLCIEKNPHLNLKTTYKQRCLYGLRHPDPSSSKACHKAARGAFSKYCSDECGVKYMQSRIDSWAKKGGKPEKLWVSVKNAEKRDGVVVCAVETETNGVAKQEDGEDAIDLKSPKQHIVPANKTKVEQETERLDALLDSVIKLREEIKHGMEVVVWRERLLQLASQRAEAVGQCGWDQRLCLDDEEWEELGDGVLESYENVKTDGDVKEEGVEGEMEVDGAEEQWWCPGDKVCDRHAGWQSVRLKDVYKEKEKKEEALAKLTTREREIRKHMEDILDPQNINNSMNQAALVKETTSNAPLRASNMKAVNGHPKSKGAAATGDLLKKGKKRKAPTS